MNATALIASFGADYSVTRRVAGTSSAGLLVAGSSSTVSIVASVQPPTGADLLRLPEGRRSEDARVLFTATQLYTGGQGATYTADRLVIDGNLFEVSHVEPWPADSTFWRAIVTAVA